MNKLCASDKFSSVRRTKKYGIHPEVHILGALKTLCYGVSANCFVDYFEMSETQMRNSVLHFISGVHEHFKETFL